MDLSEFEHLESPVILEFAQKVAEKPMAQTAW